jgi:hypothetical protein
MKTGLFALTLLLCGLQSTAQINFTALDKGSIHPYPYPYLYGINSGSFDNTWDDKSLADLAAGNPSKNVAGVGAKTFRPPLPGYFLDYWGYDIRLAEFQHYQSIGVRDNAIILGWPVEAQRERTRYGGCGDESRMFANMYEPIWDNGENGTPINENNYYALYVYNVVTRYKGYAKFWEIMNEPDYDISSSGWLGRDQPGNWWDNNPSPCSLLNMKAPIFTYIRMLRISYEVIKSIDPTAYICTGGLGLPSFLDAVLRNTDNPVDGSVTSEYPNKGGAYFDVLSFHSYPLFKLSSWSNELNGFKYERHTDKAIEVFIKDKNTMDSVLQLYGFDGNTYPEKYFICSENNISRKQTENYIGSDIAHLNFTMKVQVACQKNKILQHYIFNVAENKNWNESNDQFQYMGMYSNIMGKGPLGNAGQYLATKTDAGRGLTVIAQQLLDYTYDEALTNAMQLPNTIDGAAFKNSLNNTAFVLWAKTTRDQSEEAYTTYNFPAAIKMPVAVKKYSWNGVEENISTTNIILNGTPAIYKVDDNILNYVKPEEKESTIRLYQLKLYPNPAITQSQLQFSIRVRENVSVRIYSTSGSLVKSIVNQQGFLQGTHVIPIQTTELASGQYYLLFESDQKKAMIPFVIAR